MDRHTAARAGVALRALLLAGAGLSLAACASGRSAMMDSGRFAGPAAPQGLHGTAKPYQVKGKWYTPRDQPDYDETGIGSWYGEQFHNRRTADGEIFDMDRASAAHKTLPLPCLVEVTNLDNGRKMIVRVNDRGPFVDNRIIDLSRAAAEQLDYRRAGVARVRVRYIGPAPAVASEPRQYRASTPPRQALPARPIPYAVVAQAAPAPAPAPVQEQPEFLPPPTPRPQFAPRPSMASSAPADGFRVQVGAFSSRASAERVAASLTSAGRPEIVESPRADGVIYKVVVNGSTLERLASLGFTDARLIGAR